MSPASRVESPLIAFQDEEVASGESIGLELVEHPFKGYHNLRCDPNDEQVRKAVTDTLGLPFPPESNRFLSGGGATLYWLGPDEWLIRTDSSDDRATLDALAARLDGVLFALTDVSSGMTHIAVTGSSAEDVLRQGTTLDIHPREFGEGRCAQTMLAKTGVLLARRSDAGFDIYVRRSFADYLLRFLRDAAHDVGYRFTRAAEGVADSTM